MEIWKGVEGIKEMKWGIADRINDFFVFGAMDIPLAGLMVGLMVDMVWFGFPVRWLWLMRMWVRIGCMEGESERRMDGMGWGVFAVVFLAAISIFLHIFESAFLCHVKG